MKKVSELGIRDDYCTEMELRRFYEVPICADFECFLFLETALIKKVLFLTNPLILEYLFIKYVLGSFVDP